MQGFLECDEAMRKDETLKDEMSGSTAITALYRYVTKQILLQDPGAVGKGGQGASEPSKFFAKAMNEKC